MVLGWDLVIVPAATADQCLVYDNAADLRRDSEGRKPDLSSGGRCRDQACSVTLRDVHRVLLPDRLERTENLEGC